MNDQKKTKAQLIEELDGLLSDRQEALWQCYLS
jgi:hypothetical protein